MGRPLPGYTVALLDPVTSEPGDEGEICLTCRPARPRLMTGYKDDDVLTDEVMRGGTTTPATSRAGTTRAYITYVGRSDDVFKASDYRISPSSWRAC